MLKSLTIILDLSIFLCTSFSFVSYYLETICYVYKCLGLLRLLDDFTFYYYGHVVLKCNLSVINTVNPADFSLVLACYFLTHSFTFNLNFFILKWIYCKKHIIRSCFLIHSDNLPFNQNVYI